jgi:Uma2 family endonuclease
MTITPGTLDTVVRADHVAGPLQGHWTVDDLATLLDDGLRYEILDGVLYMTPAPVPGHQSASRWLVTYLTVHVQMTGRGAVYAAPIDLMLGRGTVPQPDVLVILKGNQRAVVGDTRIVGPPDLVIEIASPSTAAYDRDAQAGKQAAYARARIPEYWIVSLADETLEVLTLADAGYVSLGVYRDDDHWPSPVLPELAVAVRDLFVADPV